MSKVVDLSQFKKTKTPDGIEVDSIAYAVGILSELIGREWNGVLCVKTYDDNAVQVFPMGFNKQETKHFLASILQNSFEEQPNDN
jgi:hypothetical protein